jgi:hypothetical protein
MMTLNTSVLIALALTLMRRFGTYICSIK